MIIEPVQVLYNGIEWRLTFNDGNTEYAISFGVIERLKRVNEPIELRGVNLSEGYNMVVDYIQKHNQELKQRESRGEKAK